MGFDRKEKILEAVIREYVQTAEPVGSGRLAEIFDFRISPATIRLDLAELEEEGLLTHPHTSAGRIPTEKGYRLFIEKFLSATEWNPARSAMQKMEQVRNDFENCVRYAARLLTEATGEVALASAGPDHVFYTGLANLFAKPEFQNPLQVIEVSEVLDRVDDIINDYMRQFSAEPHVYVGSENPFGPQCSTILVKIQIAPRVSGLLGLVGPMRMDYQHNVAVLRKMRGLVENSIR